MLIRIFLPWWEGGWGGAKSYNGEKAWSSINDSLLSAVCNSKLYRVCVAAMCVTEPDFWRLRMSEMLPFLQPYIKEGALGGSSFPLIWVADRGLPTLFLRHTLRACSAFCSPLYSNACRSVRFLPSWIRIRADTIAFWSGSIKCWDLGILFWAKLDGKRSKSNNWVRSQTSILQILCSGQA